MVQAIQVLRFHLLELEKVSHYFCQLKTFQTDRKTLDPTTSEQPSGTKQKTSFVWVWRKVFIENFMNALFDIWYQSSGPGYEMSQIWVSMIADALPPGALSKLNCTHIEGVIPHLPPENMSPSSFQIYLRPEAVFAASFASKYLPK